MPLRTGVQRFIAMALVGLVPASASLLAAEDGATRVVQLRMVARTVPADAVVEAVNQAVVAAQVAGRIIEVRVDAGQTVKKGDLLMRLDSREAAESAAAARAALINAKAAYERTKSLQQQKFVSQAAVDKARSEYDAALANSGAAMASASHGSIVAPMAGVVAARHADAGEMASPGRPLLTLYEPKGLRVTAAVTQAQLARVRAARQAWIEFPAGAPESGRRFAASSITVLPTADTQTHALTARLGLPPEAASLATPGMAARVHFVVGQAERLTVPAGAVLRRGEVAAVYVHGADERVALRQIRLGDPVADGEIEILAGLVAGERIALDPVKAGINAKSARHQGGALPAAK